MTAESDDPTVVITQDNFNRLAKLIKLGQKAGTYAEVPMGEWQAGTKIKITFPGNKEPALNGEILSLRRTGPATASAEIKVLSQSE